MSTSSRLTEVFKKAKVIPFDDTSKFVLFSDCHRGDNSWSDDFAHNQSLFFHALTHYYNAGFSYIELGDGDELWENKDFSDIRGAHSHVFWLLREFHLQGRLHMIWGNHDIERKKPSVVEKTLYRYFDERTGKEEPLLDGLKLTEGIILEHTASALKLFLVHGHQGDLINDGLWWVGRFFVRHFWRHLQLLGVNDPTSPAKNFKKRVKVEEKIIAWARENRQCIIIGHTHRPFFPAPGKVPFFNDGSGVHPRCITGIEIQNGEIVLMKWSVLPDAQGMLRVQRDELVKPQPLQAFANIP